MHRTPCCCGSRRSGWRPVRAKPGARRGRRGRTSSPTTPGRATPSSTAGADREPIVRPGLHAHCQAGAHAAIGGLAAVLARSRIGRGQTVDVSHVEGLAAMHQYTTVMWTQARHVLPRVGNTQGALAPDRRLSVQGRLRVPGDAELGDGPALPPGRRPRRGGRGSTLHPRRRPRAPPARVRPCDRAVADGSHDGGGHRAGRAGAGCRSARSTTR